MGMFDVDDKKIQTLYHRAWLENDRGYVDPRKHPYLDKALYQYAKENHCRYDEAYILAKTGKDLSKKETSTIRKTYIDDHRVSNSSAQKGTGSCSEAFVILLANIALIAFIVFLLMHNVGACIFSGLAALFFFVLMVTWNDLS